jgi:hypothetical protein
MLEALHATHPGVRVIFAGRRWLVPPPHPAATPRLRERPYLRVLRTSGFTVDEANAYLVKREAIVLPSSLYSAILERVRRTTETGEGYNPFELAGYLDWALDDPDLTAVKLRAAPGDAYVEQRIIGRIAEAGVRAALPVAVEFGRFDLALVTPALRRAEVDSGRTFDGLATQEWVTTVETFDATGLPRVIEVDDHLRDRIRRVLMSSPAWPPVDRVLLGRDAAAVIESARALGDVTVATVTAAVRLLPVAEAARLWQNLEERVVRDDEWAWAGQVTDRVAAIEAERLAESGDQGPTILAAVRATQAASRIHNALTHDLADLWRDAELWVAQYPDPELRDRLRARAYCGRVAAGDAGVAWADRRLLEHAPGDAILAAYEGALGSPGGVRVTESLNPAAWLVNELGLDSAMRACAQITNAVAELRDGRPSSGLASFADDALAQAEAASRQEPTRWADWVPPSDLVNRARLTRLVVALRGGEALDNSTLQHWCDENLDKLDGIDAERVVAATVRLQLKKRLLLPSEIEPIASAEHYVPGRRATHWLHDQAGPLAVALAEAWHRAGEPERAEQLLRAHLEAAVNAGDDPDTIERCQEALARLGTAPKPGALSAPQAAPEPGRGRLARVRRWLEVLRNAALWIGLDEPSAYGGPEYLTPSEPLRRNHYFSRWPPPENVPYRSLALLVGTPVETAAGWRLRIRAGVASEGDATLVDLAHAFPPYTSVGTRMVPTSGDRQAPLRSEQVTVTVRPRIFLVVLQAEPVDGPPEPLDTLGAGFRGLVRNTLAGTDTAVLVVPPLPDDLAKVVIDTVWRRAARNGVARWLTSHRRLRRRVRVLVASVPAAAGEPANDVVLYTRTNPPPDEESR